MIKKIAILGAGLSGLTLATKLKNSAEVTVFEKSHSVGGRMSTRNHHKHSFDHGAQYFSVKSNAFAGFLEPFKGDHIVKEWRPNIVEIGMNGKTSPVIWKQPRYVATPGMRDLCEAIASGLNIELSKNIAQVENRDDGNWLILDDRQTLGPYDWIITTIPSHQAAVLLPNDCSIQTALSAVQMKGCYALMLGFDDQVDIPWDAALRPILSADQAISWVAVNSTKPNRNNGYSVLVQSSNDWANERLDADQNEIKTFLLRDLEDLLGSRLPSRIYEKLHKWRYANVSKPANQDYLMDEVLHLAACGDWCLHGKVEAAFLSADALARKLKDIMS
ncbi:NAD(P)/FAD-dependent oxidoreductase [Lentilitoribacter sp. EG35]|uniref:NAD(P)/FAD-dependent oxidoreductase n=1 Tax=Lentilitoribacter sp. EG35 TaxID=3234192 RepID=UPI003460EF64